MSRRPPNPAAERAAKNQEIIKSLLKLEANKVCADCKRNRHPRWSSWNLGIFLCIRCSGIHRGMGVHISRVRSVDLDSWNDEQVQSMLNWGNARANKYWEAKLAPGHVPSESKIENFIRTKYELKRWVMDGPIPDPATLDVEGDDDIPLSVVKEKQNIERRESVRKASVGQTATSRSIPAPQADLIGGEPIPPPRSSTAGPTASKIPPKAEPAPPKTTSTRDSLLGLDFLGTESAAPPRPASTTGTPATGGQSRPDLKQSILSLYASAPRPRPQPQPQVQQPASQNSTGSFGGMSSPQGMTQTQSSFGGLNDAFSSLSFSNQPGPKTPQNDAFAQLGNFSGSRPPPQANNSDFSALSAGSFFNPKPAATPAFQQQKPPISSPPPAGFGAFASPPLAQVPPPAPKSTVQPPSTALGDLFDFSTLSAPAAGPKPAVPSSSSTMDSVFNLSANQAKPPPAPAAAMPNPAVSFSSANFSNADVWGSNNWATPEPPKQSPEVTKPATIGATNDFGWGSASNSFANKPIVPSASGGFAPKVAADEEFGSWTSSTGPSGPSAGGGGTLKPAASPGNNEDLFANVWE